MNITFFDLFLVLALFWIFYEIAFSKHLFHSAVLFIIFGLVISIVWARLNAFDVALAEAAIGSGVTGAMFLEAIRHVKNSKRGKEKKQFINYLTLILGIIIAFFLILAFLNASADYINIKQMVENNLDKSGVSSPVTAVLLNFRSYDTLLEIIVLVITAVGALSLRKSEGIDSKEFSTHKVFTKVVTFLLPFLILISGYIYYLGSHAPGGAFQAGAIIAALLILLKLSGINPTFNQKIRIILIILGYAVFLFIGLIVMPFGFSFLEYPQSFNSLMIYLIEFSLVISIGLILYTLFELISSSEDKVEHDYQ